MVNILFAADSNEYLVSFGKPGVHTSDCAYLRRNSTVANKPVHDWSAYTVTTLSRPGESLKPPDRGHICERTARQKLLFKMHFPGCDNKITTLNKKRCHASDIATKKAANEVQLMAYNLRLKCKVMGRSVL